MKRIVRIVLTLAVAIAAAFYLRGHADEFLLLRQLKGIFLLPMLLLSLAAIAANGLVMRVLVRQFGVHLTFAEWYGLTALHAFGNYLPLPQAGAAARGIYLKKVHQLAYRSFTATVLVTYVQFLSNVGALGLISLALMATRGRIVPWPLWVLFAALAAAALALTRAAWSLPPLRRLSALLEPLGALRRSSVLLKVTALQVGLIAINAAGLWMAFQALERAVSPGASLMLALVSMASGVANVTPGNLGVAEAAAWVTAHLAGGADPDQAVVAYTVFRISAVVPVFLLAPLFIARLVGDRKEAS
jgi:uncharacterized membrane protein YbhN (UPF0104 family)